MGIPDLLFVLTIITMICFFIIFIIIGELTMKGKDFKGKLRAILYIGMVHVVIMYIFSYHMKYNAAADVLLKGFCGAYWGLGLSSSK